MQYCFRCQLIFEEQNNTKFCNNCIKELEFIYHQYCRAPNSRIITKIFLLLLIDEDLRPAFLDFAFNGIRFLGDSPQGLVFQTKNGKHFYLIPNENIIVLTLLNETFETDKYGTISIHATIHLNKDKKSGTMLSYFISGKYFEKKRQNAEVCHTLDEKAIPIQLSRIVLYSKSKKTQKYTTYIKELKSIGYSQEFEFYQALTELPFLKDLNEKKKRKRHFMTKKIKMFQQNILFAAWLLFELQSNSMTNAKAMIYLNAFKRLKWRLNIKSWSSMPSFVKILCDLMSYYVKYIIWFIDTENYIKAHEEFEKLLELIRILTNKDWEHNQEIQHDFIKYFRKILKQTHINAKKEDYKKALTMYLFLKVLNIDSTQQNRWFPETLSKDLVTLENDLLTYIEKKFLEHINQKRFENSLKLIQHIEDLIRDLGAYTATDYPYIEHLLEKWTQKLISSLINAFKHALATTNWVECEKLTKMMIQLHTTYDHVLWWNPFLDRPCYLIRKKLPNLWQSISNIIEDFSHEKEKNNQDPYMFISRCEDLAELIKIIFSQVKNNITKSI